MTDDHLKVAGEPESKPFRLIRVDGNGEYISEVERFATEADARAFKRRLDWRYALYQGRRRVSDFPIKE